MRQIIRLNVADQGYSLYSTDARGMRREPLDTPSDTVPRGYLAAQRRLDELFAISEGPWSMTFRWLDGECVLAYGCKIGGADQMGRPGLVLIHGILLESPRELPACVLGILSLLSPTRVGRLAASIQDVAQGNLPAQKLLDRLVREAECRMQDSRNLPAAKADRWRIGEITHDCAGAAAFVWLFFARQQANARGPWEVYDTVGDKGEPMTRLTPSGGEQAIASRLLVHLLAIGENAAASRIPEEPAPSPAAHPEEARTLKRREVPVGQEEPANKGEEDDQETAQIARPAGRGLARWLALGLVLFLAASWTGLRAVDGARDVRPRAEEAIERITGEAKRSVSSIGEARSEALERIEERTKSLLEQLDAAAHVPVSPAPPALEGCDEDREMGRIAAQRLGDRAVLYICTPEEPGWLAIGQRPKVRKAT